MNSGRGRDRSAWWAGAGFALLLCAAYLPVVLGSRRFFHFDLFYEHLPVWEVTQKALLAGDSPYWIPGEYCGYPLLFHQEAPLFYPPTVPMLATGASVSRLADLFSLGHLWLAGLLAFLLLRELTRDPRAAFFGGVAWMLSARMVQSVLWPNAVAVSALLPAILWSILRIGRGRRRSGVAGLAVSLGLALLAARPHVLVAAAPVLIAAAAAAVYQASPGTRTRALFDLALGGFLAVLIGSPSLGPTIALYPETSRSKGLTQAERDLGRVSFGADLESVFLPVERARRWPETAAYPGVLAGALFLAGIVLAARRERLPFPRSTLLALAAGGALGLVFAFGERGPYALLADLPVLRGFRVPSRYLLSWSLALALGSALALAVLLARVRRSGLVAAAAIGILAVDLVANARRVAPTAPAEVFSVRPLVAEELKSRLRNDDAGFPQRFVSVAEMVYPNSYSDAGLLALTRYLEPLRTAIGMRFGLESIGGYGPTLARTDAFLARLGPRAYALGGAGLIVSSEARPPGASEREPARLQVADFDGLPRAILVPEAIVVPSDRVFSATFSPELDVRRTAVLEEGDPMPPDPRWNPAEASVRLEEYRPGRIALRARLPAAGVLVLFDTHDAGWRPRVDGAAAPLLRADAAFQAVRLPAGEHRVELDYHPRGLVEGLLLGAAGVLATILAGLRLAPV